MSSRLRYQAAAREAERLIDDLGITDPPVDPFAIAERHDITVEAANIPSGGFSGSLVKVGDAFGILYSTSIRNDGFIRFTVSHELGHYFLPKHPELLFPGDRGRHLSKSGFTSSQAHEHEADHFAAALLMPESLLKRALNKAGLGFPAVETLSRVFETSLTATAIRYARFSYDPVAVVVSAGDRIECCFMSQTLHDIQNLSWIRKGSLLSPETVTAKFNRTRDVVDNCEKAEGCTSLDLWFDGAPEFEMQENVVGLGTYGKTLTVLFSEDPIDTDDD